MIRTVPNVMQRYGCSSETAQRYVDLREEGYPPHQALLMAGLSGPPEPVDEGSANATAPGMFDDDNAALMNQRDVDAMGGAS